MLIITLLKLGRCSPLDRECDALVTFILYISSFHGDFAGHEGGGAGYTGGWSMGILAGTRRHSRGGI
jgi:hypothetical protein